MKKKLLSLFWPPYCFVCETWIKKENEFFVDGICYPCTLEKKALLPQIQVCDVCQEPTESDSKRCLYCKAFDSPLSSIHSLYQYTPHARSLIHAYKYQKKFALKNALSYFAKEALLQSERQDILQSASFILSIPPSPRALQHRGFSHTAELAKNIATYLNVPYAFAALKVAKSKLPQALTPIIDRKKNVSGNFVVTANNLKGKSVILFDDILTSCATLESAAQALKENGAESIHALTLFRTPQFFKNRLLIKWASLENVFNWQTQEEFIADDAF